MAYDREVMTDLRCYDCGEVLLSTVRSGWCVMIHESRRVDHPVRYLAPTTTGEDW